MSDAEEWQKLVVAFKQTPEPVLKWLSYQCFEHRNTFDAKTEAEAQRNLGRREIIVMIRDWLSKEPTEIPKQLRSTPNA